MERPQTKLHAHANAIRESEVIR